MVNLEDALAKYIQFSSLINNGDEISGKSYIPSSIHEGQ
jgi:hypothetical protein